MGLRAYLRGDTLLDEHEDRALPAQSERSPLLPPYSNPVRSVTTANVLAVADAFACVRVLADSISTLPLKVFRSTPAGRVSAGDDSRAVQLLKRPSPGSTGVDLISQVLTHLNVYGDCFVGKFRADNEIVQLGVLHPDRIQIELRGQRIVYVLDRKTEHGIDDILHIKAMSMDGIRGMSPVEQCRSALGLNENLRESSRQYFEQGSRPSGILTLPPGTSSEGLERGFEAWRSNHAGVERMHQVAVVEGDVKFEPVAFSAGDSQFLQQRELSTREIARIFRVPAWAIDGGSGDSLTYSNTLEQARALVTYSLRPWLVRIERAITNDTDLCPGQTYVQFDLDGLLRADAAQRAQIYTAATDPLTGWMTRSEVRELEDLPPEPEPERSPAPVPVESRSRSDDLTDAIRALADRPPPVVNAYLGQSKRTVTFSDGSVAKVEETPTVQRVIRDERGRIERVVHEPDDENKSPDAKNPHQDDSEDNGTNDE